MVVLAIGIDGCSKCLKKPLSEFGKRTKCILEKGVSNSSPKLFAGSIAVFFSVNLDEVNPYICSHDRKIQGPQ